MASISHDPKSLDLETLMAIAEARFPTFSLFRFGDGWKAMKYAPELNYPSKSYDKVKAMKAFSTPHEAVYSVITAKDEVEE